MNLVNTALREGNAGINVEAMVHSWLRRCQASFQHINNLAEKRSKPIAFMRKFVLLTHCKPI